MFQIFKIRHKSGYFKSKISQLLYVKTNSNTKNYCVGQIKPVCRLELANLQVRSSQMLSSTAMQGASEEKGTHGDAEARAAREVGGKPGSNAPPPGRLSDESLLTESQDNSGLKDSG
jgi:hypothetical protein